MHTRIASVSNSDECKKGSTMQQAIKMPSEYFFKFTICLYNHHYYFNAFFKKYFMHLKRIIIKNILLLCIHNEVMTTWKFLPKQLSCLTKIKGRKI